MMQHTRIRHSHNRLRLRTDCLRKPNLQLSQPQLACMVTNPGRTLVHANRKKRLSDENGHTVHEPCYVLKMKRKAGGEGMET
jgi:hypothetical protein